MLNVSLHDLLKYIEKYISKYKKLLNHIETRIKLELHTLLYYYFFWKGRYDIEESI